MTQRFPFAFSDEDDESPWEGRRSMPTASLSWFHGFLPRGSLIFLAILILMAPLALLTAESLLIPLVEGFQQLFKQGIQPLPFHFFIKLGAFLLLSFLGLIQLFLRLNITYLSVWVTQFPRPHPLHVDYHPDTRLSMVALFNWYLYRILLVLGPPIGMMILTSLVGFIGLSLFNLMMGLPAFTLPFQFIIGMFVMMLLALLTGFSFLNSVWTLFTTLFGSTMAMTEPDLPARTIAERCNRIAFTSPMVYILYPAYTLFLLLVVGEIYFLLTTYNIQDFITFRANYLAIFILEAVTLVAYLALNYLKFFTYHHALVTYYSKLPRQLKEQFTPPPAGAVYAADDDFLEDERGNYPRKGMPLLGLD